MSVEVVEIRRTPHPPATLALVVAGCKGARLDWLIEKCTELGVSRIVLAEFARSVVHVGAGHVAKLERAAIEACKQCRRLWLPMIAAGLSLDDMLGGLASSAAGSERASVSALTVGNARAAGAPTSAAGSARVAATVRLLAADPRRGAARLSDVFPDDRGRGDHGRDDRARGDQADTPDGAACETVCVIGPEGGLTPAEHARLDACGARFVTLGPNVLRVETAAVCVAAYWSASRA